MMALLIAVAGLVVLANWAAWRFLREVQAAVRETEAG